MIWSGVSEKRARERLDSNTPSGLLAVKTVDEINAEPKQLGWV